MPFQTMVNRDLGTGVVGTIFVNGPIRGESFIVPRDATVPRRAEVSKVLTYAANNGNLQVGGAGIFAGIIANPKVYALYGGATGTLSPTLRMLPESEGEFVTFTSGIVVNARSNVTTEIPFELANVGWEQTTGYVYIYTGTAVPANVTAIPSARVVRFDKPTTTTTATDLFTVVIELTGTR